MALTPLLADAVTEYGTAAATETAEAIQPSRTYKVDWNTGRVGGFTDGLDALRQAIYKIIQTERFTHLIYSWVYGFESRQLIGQSRGIVEVEAERYITEALTADDRISAVQDFTIEFTGKREAVARFTVVSIFGNVEITTGVNY